MGSSWGYRRSALSFLLLVFLGLTAAFPWFEATRNANEIPRLMQGRAIAEDGTFTLSTRAARGVKLGPDLARGVDGKVHPNKPPGASIVAAGAYLTAKGADALVGRPLTLRDYGWWARLFLGVLPTLLVCFLALRRWRDDQGVEGTCMGLWLWVFAPPAFAYAHLAYGHQLAAALLFWGITRLVDGRNLHNYNDAFVGGLLAGAAVAVDYFVVFAAIPIGLAYLNVLRQSDTGLLTFVAALAGALIPIAALAGYHDLAFGSWMETGYHHAANSAFAAKHNEGLLGMVTPSWERLHTDMTDHKSGLLWWSPIVLAGLMGLGQLCMREGARQLEARLYLGILVVSVAVGACLNFEGGWRVGPRYLVPVLPGLALGWAHISNQLRVSTVALGIFLYVALYSAFANLLAGNLWPHLDLSNINSPVGDVLLPLFSKNFHPYGPLDLLGTGWGQVLSFGIPVGGLFLVLRYSSDFSILTAWVAVIALVLAGMSIWAVPKYFEPHPKAARNLEYIKSVYEPSKGNREPGRTHKFITRVRGGP
jgi:hypothetical protein